MIFYDLILKGRGKDCAHNSSGIAKNFLVWYLRIIEEFENISDIVVICFSLFKLSFDFFEDVLELEVFFFIEAVEVFEIDSHNKFGNIRIFLPSFL